MNDHENDWLELAELYALGALSPAERERFEQHLEQNAGEGVRHLREKVRETRDALVFLAKELPPAKPSDAVTAQIFERIDQTAARPFWDHGWCIAVAAFALAALGANLWAGNRTAVRFEQRVAALQQELGQSKPVLELISNELTRVVELKGLEAAPGASAYLFWNPETRQGFFSGRNLPGLTPQKVYELWALAGSQPVRAGVFEVDVRGNGTFSLPDLPAGLAYDTFAVTIEPSGGTDAPTGAMVLAGKV